MCNDPVNHLLHCLKDWSHRMSYAPGGYECRLYRGRVSVIGRGETYAAALWRAEAQLPERAKSSATTPPPPPEDDDEAERIDRGNYGA